MLLVAIGTFVVVMIEAVRIASDPTTEGEPGVHVFTIVWPTVGTVQFANVRSLPSKVSFPEMQRLFTNLPLGGSLREHGCILES